MVREMLKKYDFNKLIINQSRFDPNSKAKVWIQNEQLFSFLFRETF